MTVYPIEIDSSLNLPAAVNGVSPVNAQAVNQLRDAVIAIESELGVKPSGVYGTVKENLETLSSDMQNVILTVDDALASMQTSIDESIISIQEDLAVLADGGAIFLASGDLDGSGVSQVVVGIQGVPVSDATPSNQQVLVYDGSVWAPGTVNSFVAAGDLSGDNTTQTVIQIQGRPVDAAAPNSGDVYVWDGDSWAPGASFVPGGDLTGTVSSQDVVSLTGATGVVSIPTAALAFGAAPAATGEIRFGGTSGILPHITWYDGSADRNVFWTVNASRILYGDDNVNSELRGVTVALLQSNGLDAFKVNGTTDINISLPLTFGATASATGTIRLKNLDSIKSLDYAGGADHILAGTDVSDNLFIGGNIDGSSAHPQVLISPASYGYLRAGGTDAMLWNTVNLLIAQPAIGYNLPYSVHGGVVFAFLADADYVVDSAVYQYDWNEFTVGVWTGAHSVVYPLPVTKDRGYYKTIFNNTIYTITVSTGTGTTQELLAGITRRFWFDNSGVSISGFAGIDTGEYEIYFASGLFSTTSTSFVRTGARLIDITAYPETIGNLTRIVTFFANIDMTAGATTVEVRLYDSTHSVAVTGTTLTSSSLSNAQVSALLTVGSSAGNIRSDVASQYELQFKMNGGGGSDAVFLTDSRVVITYE